MAADGYGVVVYKLTLLSFHGAFSVSRDYDAWPVPVYERITVVEKLFGAIPASQCQQQGNPQREWLLGKRRHYCVPFPVNYTGISICLPRFPEGAVQQRHPHLR